MLFLLVAGVTRVCYSAGASGRSITIDTEPSGLVVRWMFFSGTNKFPPILPVADIPETAFGGGVVAHPNIARHRMMLLHLNNDILL
jgi:hypothetical protein